MRGLLLGVLLFFVVTPCEAFEATKTPVAPDGGRATIDLPVEMHRMNSAGIDGYGLCVFTSVTVAASWQNEPSMAGFQRWAEGRPGGSLPDLLVADLKEYERQTGRKVPAYIQHTGGDAAFLELVYKTRRMPGVAYAGYDTRYGLRNRIYHMVNGAHLDNGKAAIIDNNFPGSWYWMERGQFLNRWRGLSDARRQTLPFVRPIRLGRMFDDDDTPLALSSGDGWAFVWLAPPPPPVPVVGPEPAKPTVIWEKRVLDGFDHWFAWKGETFLGVWHSGAWHKACGPNCWESESSPLPSGLTPPSAFVKAGDDDGPVHTPKYWINGEPVDEARARAELLTDDSDKYHLSVVGVDRLVVAGWFAKGGPLEKYEGRVHVQAYAREDWAVSRLPAAVVIQEPAKVGGKVARSGDKTDAESVKALLASLFDPPTVPAPSPRPVDPPEPKPTPAPGPAPQSWLVALIAILTWLFSRSK